MRRSWMKGAALSLAAIMFLTACSSGGSGEKKMNNTAPSVLYMKDGEMEYIKLDGDRKPMQITKKLDMEDGSYAFPTLPIITTISADGNKMVYVDDVDPDQHEGKLYYREITKDGLSDAKKIDADIADAYVNENFTSMIYVTTNGGLYYYDFAKGEKERLDKGVVGMVYPSEDGKRVVYERPEKGTYELEIGGEKKKIADVINMVYASADLSLIYYIDDGVLYKKSFGQEEEEIDEDVLYVPDVYDTGEMYYVKNTDTKIDWAKFIDDDMVESDKNMEYVEEPGYPSRDFFSSDAEYEKAYLQYQKQQEKYQKFSEMTIRSEMRHRLENDEMIYQGYELHYYDGKQSKLVTDSLHGSYFWSSESEQGSISRGFSYNEGKAVGGYLSYGDYEGKPIPLSEIMEKNGAFFFDLDSMLEVILKSYSGYYLVINGTPSQKLLDFKTDPFGEIRDLMKITPSGDRAYLATDIREKGKTNIYKVDISNGKAGEATEFLEDVDIYATKILKDGSLIYTKTDSKDNMELILSDEVRLKEAYPPWKFNYNPQKDLMIIRSYEGSEDGETALWVYDMKEAEKIVDKEGQSILLASGDIVYIKDFDHDKMKGDLYLYVKDGDDIKLAEGVSDIIDPRLSWEDFAG